MTSAARTEAACLTAASNDLATVIHRPHRMVTEVFDVFVTTGGGGLLSYDPKPLGSADTFEDAVRLGEASSGHGFIFYVRRRDLRPVRPLNAADNTPGQVLLHFFIVRKSTKRFVTRPALDGGYPVKEGALFSELLHTIRANDVLASGDRDLAAKIGGVL